jgi:polyhydroxybutyrate depolymerase
MRRSALHGASLALAAVPALAAGASAGVNLEVDVGGVERSALVFPGEHADTSPAPLVLLFHGLGDTSRNFARALQFEADWPEATVAYPLGRPRADRQNLRGWQVAPGGDARSELAFVEALLAGISARYRVDHRRIYAGGFSNGGHLTFALLTGQPCRFAAFAPVGALASGLENATVPRPVLYLFGRNEPREHQVDWQRTVVALARMNRATGVKREWAPGHTEFVAAPGGAATVYALYNAGHVWPYSGNEHIVRFFRSHRLSDADCAARTTSSPRGGVEAVQVR